MRFNVLGTLEVEHGGSVLTPRAAKQRQVLALLLVNANKTVKMCDLLHDLWSSNPPMSAVNTLQTYILRIRRILDVAATSGGREHGKAMLVTQPSGYLLKVGPDQLDLHEFDQLVACGTEALEAGDHSAASLRLRKALQLCRGPVLADISTGPVLGVHVVRLRENILRAVELRIEADLHLGRHRQLIGELSGLVAEHTTHERLHGYLMIALYHAGRQVDALEVYHRLRATFIHELGLEPTAWLTRIQHAVLSGNLDVRRILADRAGGSGTPPTQPATWSQGRPSVHSRPQRAPQPAVAPPSPRRPPGTAPVIQRAINSFAR